MSDIKRVIHTLLAFWIRKQILRIQLTTMFMNTPWQWGTMERLWTCTFENSGLETNANFSTSFHWGFPVCTLLKYLMESMTIGRNEGRKGKRWKEEGKKNEEIRQNIVACSFYYPTLCSRQTVLPALRRFPQICRWKIHKHINLFLTCLICSTARHF